MGKSVQHRVKGRRNPSSGAALLLGFLISLPFGAPLDPVSLLKSSNNDAGMRSALFRLGVTDSLIPLEEAAHLEADTVLYPGILNRKNLLRAEAFPIGKPQGPEKGSILQGRVVQIIFQGRDSALHTDPGNDWEFFRNYLIIVQDSAHRTRLIRSYRTEGCQFSEPGMTFGFQPVSKNSKACRSGWRKKILFHNTVNDACGLTVGTHRRVDTLYLAKDSLSFRYGRSFGATERNRMDLSEP